MYNNLDPNFKMTNEDILLILCARTELNNELKVNLIEILNKKIDWDYLIQKAFDHKVMPLLYWTLKEYNESVPEKRLNSLKEYFHSNIQKNLLLFGELLKILELFKSADITVVPYKGPILSILVYGKLALRQFEDLDIFVFKKDILKVKEILISQGYQPEFNIDDKIGKRYISSQRELKFFNNSKKTTIEIHWDFSGVFFSLPKNKENILYDNLKTINIHNRPIITPSNEELLLILCLHNANHQWTRLEWISDIYELISKFNIDWQIVIEKADKLFIKRILYINLSLAADLFDLFLPKDILEYLNSYTSLEYIIKDLKENLLGNNNQKGLLWEVILRFKIRENIIYGIKDCLMGLTKPSFYEFNNFPLPDYLFPLYYIYRPIMLMRRFNLFK